MTEKLKKFIECLTGEQKEQLKAILEVEEKPQSKVWKPDIGYKYWFVTDYGVVAFDVRSAGSNFFKWHYISGNCFRTKEEAEFYKEKLLVTAELQRFADEHNEAVDWNEYTNNKYFLVYSYINGAITIECRSACKVSEIVFSSFEIAKQAIETIGEERIKKYYLGVRE